MATNSSDGLSYFLVLDEKRKDDLGAIRHWTNLKVGFDAGKIWIKNLDYSQANTTIIKSIPYKKIFYEKEGMLYLQNSLLPDRVIPSLIWSAIDRALPIDIPSFNHNFFGINEKVAVKLIPSDAKFEAVGILTAIAHLKSYIETAPAIRLKGLTWVVLENEQALILGTPLLPIQGDAFWKYQDMFIPTGFDFEIHLLRDTVHELLNPTENKWIIWQEDASYIEIEKNAFKPLTLSGFRLTKQY